jgi:hypothetical protein
MALASSDTIIARARVQALLQKALHDRDAAPRDSHTFIRTAYAVRIAALKEALACFEDQKDEMDQSN